MAERITIALAGNPNAGKTSLFNQLTGARAHVGNYPGVTVQKREGTLKHRGMDIHVVDLPGTYSLTAYSLEELVARNYIVDERPDVVVDVVDASNLDRNLYLALQFMEIGVPVVIALNMMDMAEARGLKIDVEKLGDLLGVAVVPTVARQGKGLDRLMDAVVEAARGGGEWQPKNIRYGHDLDIAIRDLSGLIERKGFMVDKFVPKWLAVKAFEGDEEVLRLLDLDPDIGPRVREAVRQLSEHFRATLDDEPEGVIADHRYGFITSVTKQAVTTLRDIRQTVSDKVDMVALNRLMGPLVLLAVLYGIYQFTFWASETPVSWFEAFFGWLGEVIRTVLPPGVLQSLLVSGIIDGVGGVVGFVPLIAFMFFAIAILEDSGYMARIAFIMDRVLRTFGLHGNSVLALMVGGGISGGCAVPGVMAARTLRDPKERLATILVTPFMNCGAKLPLYVVLISAFFPRYQAKMLFILTLIAWGMALAAARLLRWSILRGEHTPFVMELPAYRMPTLKGLLIHTWERVWEYLKKAGTIILAVSILIWALMTYPGLPQQLAGVFQYQRDQAERAFAAGPAAAVLPNSTALDEFYAYLSTVEARNGAVVDGVRPEYQALAAAIQAIRKQGEPPSDLQEYGAAARAYLDRLDRLAAIDGAESHAALRYSFAGYLGRALESVTRPLGFDWRTNIALVGGFAAKEVVVSTLGTAYSLSGVDDGQTDSLSARLATEPGWSPLQAFALMLFVMMYSPCFVTLITIGREAGWKWALFSMAYSTAAAYLAALSVTWLGRLAGLG